VSDPLIESLRGRIAEHDLAILEAMNARLELVAELREHKRATGVEFVDAEQEKRLLNALEQASGGPLSREGVRRLFREILALTKEELG
jgi:chorismate mutase